MKKSTISECLISTVCITVAWLAPSAASALLINVDFNTYDSSTYSGAAVLGSPGDWWNGVVVSRGVDFPSDLADRSGAWTGVWLINGLIHDVSPFDGWNLSWPSGPEAGFFVGTPLAPLMNDYAYVRYAPDVHPSPLPTITLFGLDATLSYELILYSAANLDGRGTIFSVAGQSEEVVATAGTSFVEGQNYASFIVSPTEGPAGGELTIAMDFSGTDPEFNLNGLQLREVPPAPAPEPATAGLLGLGLGLGLAGISYRRRKRLTA
jgi:hypothetical protein